MKTTARMLDVRTWRIPFRVGATSYIVDAGLVENARFLAPHIQDMQLVLFDIPDGPSNMPDSAAVNALATIGARYDLTYCVHLLDDLQSAPVIADRDAMALHASLRSAQRVIEQTQPLTPYAWIGHLHSSEIRAAGFAADTLSMWWAQAVEAVRQVSEWSGGAHKLAIENLEGYPPDLVTPVVECTQAGRCVDAGHLWLDRCDPLFHLRAAWHRLRVVHLHGVINDHTQNNRDHRSLAVMAEEAVDSVVHFLLRNDYRGVLTLEIFGEEDFWSSLDALHASIQRYNGARHG